jgi:hypothetical protein
MSGSNQTEMLTVLTIMNTKCCTCQTEEAQKPKYLPGGVGLNPNQSSISGTTPPGEGLQPPASIFRTEFCLPAKTEF